MRRLTRFAFAAASLVMSTAWATEDTVTFPPREESVPPPSVKHWIKYMVLGPRNAPFPIILISTRQYEPLGILETLIVVSRRRYDIAAKFTESLSAECMNWPLQEPPAWYTLGIFDTPSDHLGELGQEGGTAAERKGALPGQVEQAPRRPLPKQAR